MSPSAVGVIITATPLLLFTGGPTTCVYAMSASSSDILSALKLGHAYITYSATGPTLELNAGDSMLGDSVDFSRVKQLRFNIGDLVPGDVVQVVTSGGNIPLLQAETEGAMRGGYSMQAPGFAYIEVLRSFLPGLPLLPALISNPIYFDR